MSNEASTYQAFFDRLDATIVELEGLYSNAPETNGYRITTDAADLLRRAGFVLLSLMNGLASTLPHLILEDEPDSTPATVSEASDV